MRKSIVALLLVALFLPGCSMIKDYVVQTATDTASIIVTSQLNGYYKNKIVPQLEMVETKLEQKIDKDADGVWSETELMTMIQAQSQDLITGGVQSLAEKMLGVESKVAEVSAKADGTQQAIDEKLQNVATKEDGIKGLLALIAVWILAKLGVKVGPKGLGPISDMFKKKPEKDVDLS